MGSERKEATTYRKTAGGRPGSKHQLHRGTTLHFVQLLEQKEGDKWHGEKVRGEGVNSRGTKKRIVSGLEAKTIYHTSACWCCYRREGEVLTAKRSGMVVKEGDPGSSEQYNSAVS